MGEQLSIRAHGAHRSKRASEAIAELFCNFIGLGRFPYNSVGLSIPSRNEAYRSVLFNSDYRALSMVQQTHTRNFNVESHGELSPSARVCLELLGIISWGLFSFIAHEFA